MALNFLECRSISNFVLCASLVFRKQREEPELEPRNRIQYMIPTVLSVESPRKAAVLLSCGRSSVYRFGDSIWQLVVEVILRSRNTRRDADLHGSEVPTCSMLYEFS